MYGTGSGQREQNEKMAQKEQGTAVTAQALARVRSVDLLRDLDPDSQARFARLLRERQYTRGEMIVHEGEPCEALYTVAEGLVKRFKLSPDGKEQVLKMLGPGDSFNEVPVLDGGPNPSSAEAVQDSVVCILRREDFLRLLEESPALSAAIVQILAGRLRHLVGLVEDLSLRQVIGRLARLLLDQPEMVSRLTHQQIASMVGATREVVGRGLHELERRGAIEVRSGRVAIVSRDRLEQLV